MTRESNPAPVKGHKCKGASFGVRVSCECGWESGTWYGKGARAEAYADWRHHVERHSRKTEAS